LTLEADLVYVIVNDGSATAQEVLTVKLISVSVGLSMTEFLAHGNAKFRGRDLCRRWMFGSSCLLRVCFLK
jgi:hypothetical protein